jgi:hypothetical protein
MERRSGFQRRQSIQNTMKVTSKITVEVPVELWEKAQQASGMMITETICTGP